MKPLSMIVAYGDDNVIGVDGKVPWRCPEDMKFFKETTMGHAVIMGRKTWDSIPVKFRPLPGRMNIVLTRGAVDQIGTNAAASLEAALDMAYKCDVRPFIIGGAEVYRQAFPLVTEVYATRVDWPPCDEHQVPEILGEVTTLRELEWLLGSSEFKWEDSTRIAENAVVEKYVRSS